MDQTHKPNIDTSPEHNKARTYFKRLLESPGIDTTNINVILVMHIVESARPFLPALAEHFALRAIYAKRSSVDEDVEKYLRIKVPEVPIRRLNRQRFHDAPESIVDEVFPKDAEPGHEEVILVDIGGYFAESPGLPSGPDRIQKALAKRGYHLLGIVEDTENGHKRYERVLEADEELSVPIYSVARSPLKKPENHLVGVAVTFSIESILRKSNVVLQSRRAGVIGFGPIGRSVAHTLRNRGIPVRVCEVDPVLLAIAAAQGFHVHHYQDDFISFAHDLNLIVSATGAGAHIERVRQIDQVSRIDVNDRIAPPRLTPHTELPLNASTVGYLEAETYVASVTSADDEIDLAGIRTRYVPEQLTDINPDLWGYKERQSSNLSPTLRPPHQFYLMMNGDAVNFRHGGVIGPAIQLLQGEIIACMHEVALKAPSRSLANAHVRELTKAQRAPVANVWLDQYLVENLQRG